MPNSILLTQQTVTKNPPEALSGLRLRQLVLCASAGLFPQQMLPISKCGCFQVKIALSMALERETLEHKKHLLPSGLGIWNKHPKESYFNTSDKASIIRTILWQARRPSQDFLSCKHSPHSPSVLLSQTTYRYQLQHLRDLTGHGRKLDKTPGLLN